MDSGHRICIDLGGTKIEIGLFNGAGELEWRKKIPTHTERGGTQAMDRIAEEVRAMLAEHPRVLPGGVGLCTPGPIDDKTGIVYNACNVPWGEFPIAAEIERRLKLPTVVDHDAKVAALGEYYFGLKEQEKNFVYIVIGTGVGGAIIYNGELFRGVTNCAGEIGFITIDHKDTDAVGIPGHAESYLGGPDITEYYQRQRNEHETVDVKIIGERARAGDAAAQAAIERAGKALGILTCTLATTLDITLFILGSSVAKLGEQLIEPAYRAIRHYSHSYFTDKIAIRPCILTNDASLVGCYYLIQQALARGTVKSWN